MYAKLFSSITESSLWSEANEVRLLFVTMLAKADPNGFIEAAVPGLARAANLTVEETEGALEILQAPDPYSKNPDNEGRRVLRVPGGFVLLNYEDYRARRSSEERREYMREYMKDYRKRRKQDVNTVKRGKPRLAQEEEEEEEEANTNKETSSQANKNLPKLVFEAFKESAAIKKPTRLTDGRRNKLRTRLRDPEWPWREAIAKLPIPNDAKFDWQPDFDWLIANSENAEKLAAGNYDRSEVTTATIKPKREF